MDFLLLIVPMSEKGSIKYNARACVKRIISIYFKELRSLFINNGTPEYIAYITKYFIFLMSRKLVYYMY